MDFSIITQFLCCWGECNVPLALHTSVNSRTNFSFSYVGFLLCKLCVIYVCLVSFSPELCEHSIDLGDLMNDVAAVIPAKWRLVGVQLKLPTGTLDEIQAQNSGRPDECKHSFEQVFTRWRSLGTSPYTWKTMIGALCSPAVGEEKLANKINTKYNS